MTDRTDPTADPRAKWRDLSWATGQDTDPVAGSVHEADGVDEQLRRTAEERG